MSMITFALSLFLNTFSTLILYPYFITRRKSYFLRVLKSTYTSQWSTKNNELFSIVLCCRNINIQRNGIINKIKWILSLKIPEQQNQLLKHEQLQSHVSKTLAYFININWNLGYFLLISLKIRKKKPPSGCCPKLIKASQVLTVKKTLIIL